jgi:Nucleotidyl transferase AbiEii toxin, Type IV TA system
MIDPMCLTKVWIEDQGRILGCSNAILLEKAIVALQLVGHLAEAGLPFQFKGGTSLLLIASPIRRLSIDADIVSQASPVDLDRVLQSVGLMPPFNGIEHDAARDKALPPKKHYRALYRSNFPPLDGHVLLDVLFETAHVAGPTLIRTPFIKTLREVHAQVPTANELLGDKLTAFAPTTIGILQHPDRTVDVVKQLFDVSVLFDVATDIDEAAEVYAALHQNQCRYRTKDYTVEETLNDTISACLGLTWCELKGPGKDDPIGIYLKDGVQRLQSHIINGRFDRDPSRIAAGKAACAAALILRRPQIALDTIRYANTSNEEIGKAEISGKWAPLQRLRGGNAEAFFYWWQAQRILGQA